MSTIDNVAARLDKKSNELAGGLRATWRHPGKALQDPLKARIKDSWPTIKDRPAVKDANGHLWYYADFVFPESLHGFSLREGKALMFLRGILPFTMWIDGEELFRETHAWMATGPIAEPFPVDIVPGKTYRFVSRIEPIHVGVGHDLSQYIVPQACIDAGLELEAASAQIRYAQALARNDVERHSVEKAALHIDLKALEQNRWTEVLASIRRMETGLQGFSGRAREMTLHLVGHSHIDMDWQWTWNDTVHCARRDFKAVTDLMDDYSDLTFSCSQIPLYDICRKMDPGVFAKVKQRVAEGRWENAAGTWVEGDLNMADGESIARHMLYARDWTRKHLASEARVLWEPDTFGHPGNMPQLAKLGEFDTYFHLRCNPGPENGMWPARHWTGVDGTSMIVLSSWYADTLEPRAIMRDVLWCLQAGRKTAFHLWGIGDHGGALSRFQIQQLARYRNKPVMPRFEFSTTARVLKSVTKEKDKLPSNTGETHTIFEGCYTTHARIKAHNRKSEGALLAAESLVAMAHAAGATIDRNTVLRDAWTPVLFNQFHDIFDGCSIPAAYADAWARAEKSQKTAARVAKEATELLVASSRKSDVLTLLNPLGFDRTEPVRVSLPPATKCLVDQDGVVIPVQKLGREFVFIATGVPALSAKSYRVFAKVPKGDGFPEVKVSTSQYVAIFDMTNATEASLRYYDIETEHASLRLCRNNGIIGSYFDKRLGRELVAHGVPRPVCHVSSARSDLGLNVFQIIDESSNDIMAAWLINRIQREENLIGGAEVTLLETGPVFARFRVAHKFRASSIDEEILVYREFPRVDFEAVIDWNEKGGSKQGIPQLKVGFNVSMRAPRFRTEGPFIVSERPADGDEVPTQKWAALSGDECGFSLCNDSKYGCDALGGRLRMTLLRNSYTPDPDSDAGVHRVRFSFAPHAPGISSAALVREGMAFNRPCVGVAGKMRAGAAVSKETPLLRIEGADSVVCTAFRKAEHSDALVVRLFESSGNPCRIRFSLGNEKRGIRSAQEVNFLENPTARPAQVAGGSVSARFRAFEVKTFLVTL